VHDRAASERLVIVRASVSDLGALELGGRRVDAVFSTAVFHWIADHDLLFSRLHAVLEPGGQSSRSAAGRNCPSWTRDRNGRRRWPVREYLAGWSPWNYAAPDETAERLQRAGFSDHLHRAGPGPVPYTTSSSAARQLAQRPPAPPPEELREDFVEAVYLHMDDDIASGTSAEHRRRA